jgi:AcrR family transcriptional regulator
VIGVTATSEPLDDELRAADGRVPGRRGRATRQRLLEETAAMLRTSSYRDLKVVDIARAAGTSPATFYQYFPDVESAILVLAEDLVARGGARLTGIVRAGTWDGPEAYDSSLALVLAVMEVWEEGRGVLRVVELANAEGDARFKKVRIAMLNELTRALSEVVAHTTRSGRHPDDLDPMATAGVLVSMLAHVASHRYGFEFWGIRTRSIERSMARILHTTLTGQEPPPDA